MHSTLSLLIGARLKNRLFPRSKSTHETDGADPKEPSSGPRARSWRRRVEKWSYLSKLPENQASGEAGGLPSSSKATSHGVTEQEQELEAMRDGNVQEEAVAGSPRVVDCIAILRKYRDVNAQVLNQIFELNTMRAPMFTQTEDVVNSLQGLLRQVTDHIKSVDLPEQFTVQLGDIHRTFDLFRKGPFASFRAEEARCAYLENTIIQSLFHSGRRLDGFLQTNADDSAFPESNTIVSLADEQEDLEEEHDEHSPEDIRYLSMIGDREMILEQLCDLRGEQRELLEEQKSRAHFGLSLDEDSLRFLSSFEPHEEALLDELEYADLGVEALKQLMSDDEALAVSNETSGREPDEDEGAIKYLEREILLRQPISPSPRKEMQSRFYKEMLHRKIRLIDHLRGPDMTPADPSDFINAWLLHRLRFLPRLLGEYTSLTETHYEEVDDEDLEHVFLEKWFNDSSAADFAKHRTFADEQSMQASLAESRDLTQRSLSAIPIPAPSLPLLSLGPSTTTEDIIAHAMQARGISPSPLSPP
ncbi:hypothetical protein AYL99_00054 [Fonsecaea erecta]|uniref:Uncharacterized protein n=1 Tax=Fonsecaea erecta TaxID=1367422 RepID=A0A178ZWL7_9EURO|nr:hypothetical protein AYL99_00054 [Fonsecaea erecta]OAP64082.1 hypothetical protein AYL99_00054 [Fonsecaea erecta]